MEKKNKIYTVIDFARYHGGNMEAKEMHALEKAALEDPFLADALEGYMHTNSATEDVQHLKSLLAEKTTKKKVYPIASISQNVWWRVAAIFILIGIAGYFFFDLGLEDGNTIAKNELNNVNQRAGQTPGLDSPATAMMMEYGNSGEIKANFPKNEKEEAAGSVARLNHKSTHTQKPLSAPLSENFSYKRIIEDTTLDPTDYVAVENIGKVVAKNREAAARMKVAENNNLASVSLLKEDTPKMAYQSSVASGKSVNIKEAELSEVVVAGDSRNRKITSKTSPAMLPGQVIHVIISPQSKLQPIEGLENYRYYISTNKQEVRDEKKHVLQGSILLEFSINKEGKPIDIRVKNSDCFLCEKQAISLLENGPLWKGKSNEKGEMTIQF